MYNDLWFHDFGWFFAHVLELWYWWCQTVACLVLGLLHLEMVLATAEECIFNIEQDFLLDYVLYLDAKIWNENVDMQIVVELNN